MSTPLLDYMAEQVALVGPPLSRVAPLALGYGTDLSCVTDITDDLRTVDPTTRTAISEALIRRLITPRGSVIDDPNYGFDLRGYLNRGTTLDELRSLSASIRAEALKDDRVIDADADVSFDLSTNSLSVELAINAEDATGGTFNLVFWVTADGAELVESIGRNG